MWKVLDHYQSVTGDHLKNKTPKAIIFIAELEKFSQFFQTISFFGAYTTLAGGAIYSETRNNTWIFGGPIGYEKEIILPPFCDFVINKFDFTKLKNQKEQENMAWALRMFDFNATWKKNEMKKFDKNQTMYQTDFYMITDIQNCAWKNKVTIEADVAYQDHPFFRQTPISFVQNKKRNAEIKDLAMVAFMNLVEENKISVSPYFCEHEYFFSESKKNQCYRRMKLKRIENVPYETCKCEYELGHHDDILCESYEQTCEPSEPVCFYHSCIFFKPEEIKVKK